MNKDFALVTGASKGLGKTSFMFRMLQKELFQHLKKVKMANLIYWQAKTYHIRTFFKCLIKG